MQGQDTRLTTVIKVNGRDRDKFLADPDFVYVGRMFAGFHESIWGNPFKVGMARSEAIKILGRDVDNLIRADRLSDRTAVVFYAANVRDDPKLMALLPTLRGKTLGCWCGVWKPGDVAEKACHAVWLANMANKIREAE